MCFLAITRSWYSWILKHKNSIHKQQKAFPAILPYCQVGSYYFSNWSCICTSTFNSPWKPFVSWISLFLHPASTHTTRSSAYHKCHIPGSNQAYSDRACTVVQTWSLAKTQCTWNESKHQEVVIFCSPQLDHSLSLKYQRIRKYEYIISTYRIICIYMVTLPYPLFSLMCTTIYEHFHQLLQWHETFIQCDSAYVVDSYNVILFSI